MKILQLIESFGFTKETLIEKFGEAVKSSIYEKFNNWQNVDKLAVVITVSMNGNDAMLTYNHIALVGDFSRTTLIEVGIFSDLIVKLFDSADLMTRSAIDIALNRLADGMTIEQCATLFDGFAASALSALESGHNGICLYLDAGGGLGCNEAVLLPTGTAALGKPFDITDLFNVLISSDEPQPTGGVDEEE